MNSYIKLSGITKEFVSTSGHKHIAIDNLNLEIKHKELLSVVGKSGSGKSTLLSILSKIEPVSSGKVEFSNNIELDKVGFVFQENTVFPWRTVKKNIGFPLEIQGLTQSEIQYKTKEILGLVGLNPDIFLNKYPKELSGGEKRRVAIGMALAHDAKLLLLDEPTSQLDDFNKFKFQILLQNLWLNKEFTCIVVTHDIEEALFLGDRVLVLKDGKCEKIINVDLPRPREINTRGLKKFINYRTQILELL